MLNLNGVCFNRASIASGALGFDYQGYWIHKYLKKYCGLDCSGADLIVKTSPIDKREGNMELDPLNFYRPKRKKPNCIKINFLTKSIVNSVNLSTPGLKALLALKIWQNFEDPFWISFMPVGETREIRLKETRKFVYLIKLHKHYFKSAFGVQLNISCPNTGHDKKEIENESTEHLVILSELNVPTSVKFNIFIPVKTAKEISKHCNAIFTPNTIPWGATNEIPWNRLFLFSAIFRRSPIPKKYGAGGYSGVKQFPFVIRWLKEARTEGIDKPIYIGSLFKPEHVDIIKCAGGSGITIGATAIYFYPGNVQKIIQKTNEMKWR